MYGVEKKIFIYTQAQADQNWTSLFLGSIGLNYQYLGRYGLASWVNILSFHFSYFL